MQELANYQLDPMIVHALNEDITNEDISANSVGFNKEQATVDLIAKQEGIIAGLAVFKRVFEILDPNVEFNFSKRDGDAIQIGEVIATIHGQAGALLTAERVALNYLQRMSGIASYTNTVVQMLEGSNIKLMDTRKTTPGLRLLEKYSVRVGGGHNHRYNLSDAIMLKDNHISLAGGVGVAIDKARQYAPYIKKIEVEVETLEMVKEAVEHGADIIMLDNMDVATMRKAIEIIDGKAIIEASGNLTKENIDRLKGLDIHYLSSGAITHSAGILDLSMKNLKLNMKLDQI